MRRQSENIAVSSLPFTKGQVSARGRFYRTQIVGRSFSGDKNQLVPLIKAAIEHKGPAFIDCISPCVAFNNHEGSTKSFDYVREHNEAVNALDFITTRAPITAGEVFGRSEFITPQGDLRTLPCHLSDADPRRAGLDGFYAARLRKR